MDSSFKAHHSKENLYLFLKVQLSLLLLWVECFIYSAAAYFSDRNSEQRFVNFLDTGTPPLTQFFWPRKNRVKGKPRYRRSILVLKPQNGEFESSKSIFS